MTDTINLAEKVLKTIASHENPTITIVTLKKDVNGKDIDKSLKILISLDIIHINWEAKKFRIYPSKNFYSAVKSEKLIKWIDELEEKKSLEKNLIKSTIETQKRIKIVSFFTLLVAIISAIAMIYNIYKSSALSDFKTNLNNVEKKIEHISKQLEGVSNKRTNNTDIEKTRFALDSTNLHIKIDSLNN